MFVVLIRQEFKEASSFSGMSKPSFSLPRRIIALVSDVDVLILIPNVDVPFAQEAEVKLGLLPH